MSETISKSGHGGARANSGGVRPGAGRPRKIQAESHTLPTGPAGLFIRPIRTPSLSGRRI